jgi:dipeptidase E
MHLLLGSGGFRTPERVQLLAEQMRSFFGPVEKLLFVPYALADHDGYVQAIVSRGMHAGYTIEGLHRFADPVAAVRAAQGLYIGGGNTFRLLNDLYRYGLLDVIRERARSGMPFLGISAGCNVACPTIKTTNDMPIVQPASLDALGLVPFQVNPHYVFGPMFRRVGEVFEQHFGETRDERIAEFHQLNDTLVIGLSEGGLLRVEQDRVTLVGAPARLFRKGGAPVDVAPGAEINFATDERRERQQL